MGNPTVTPQYEQWHNGGFLVSQPNGHQHVEPVILASGTKYLAGTVLGLITSALTATAAVLGSNTGNGTFGTITPTAAPGTALGTYSVVYTSASAFTVTAPNGATATGSNGVAFSALGIGFTVTAGGTAFVAGDGFTITITGTVGVPTFASAANAGNTGNGTIGSTSVVGYAALPGAYIVEFDDATHYSVSDPLGRIVGHGTTGVAYKSGGLGFTITAGGTAFAAGDSFAITVAAGSGKAKAWDPANTDGSQVVAGILFAGKDATSADKPGLAIVRLSEVNASELVWPTGITAAGIAQGLAGLRALGIIPR